jgi:hypothetical protein
VFRSVGDYCNYNSSGVVLHVGGNYSQNQNHGAFYLNGNNSASNTNANIGSRILVRTKSPMFESTLLQTLSQVCYRSGIEFGAPLGEDYVERDEASTPERAQESFIDNKESSWNEKDREFKRLAAVG